MPYAITEHEYTLDGGTTVQPCTSGMASGADKGVIPVGDVAKAIGQVGVRVKAAAGRNASAWLFNGAPFTVSPVASSISPVSADFAYTVYDRDATTHRKRSAFAMLALTTNGAYLTVEFISLIAANGYSGADSFISIYDSLGNFVTHLAPQHTTTAVHSVQTADLPGSGSRLFYLVESGSTRNGDHDFFGTSITKVTAPQGSTVAVVAPVSKPNRALLVADSIGIGDGTDNNSRYGWPIVLRKMLREQQNDAWSVTTDAWGARKAHDYTTSAVRTEQANRIINHFAGATGRKVLLWLLGTNDFGFNGDPTLSAARSAAIWDLVKVAVPDLEVILTTPLWRANMNTPTNAGYVLADFANALKAEANNRAAFVKHYDGVPLLDPATHFHADNLHPNNAGHAVMADWQYKFIMGLVTEPPVPEVDKAYVINNTQWSNDFGAGINFATDSLTVEVEARHGATTPAQAFLVNLPGGTGGGFCYIAARNDNWAFGFAGNDYNNLRTDVPVNRTGYDTLRLEVIAGNPCTMNCYVNKVLKHTRTAAPWALVGKMYMGTTSTFQSPFTGWLDNIKIWRNGVLQLHYDGQSLPIVNKAPGAVDYNNVIGGTGGLTLANR